MTLFRCLSYLIALVLSTSVASAADWPQRPITIVVGFNSAGASFLVTRAIGTKLSERLGQTVTVEERSGASGTIASQFVGRSAPDGYVFGVLSNSTVIANLVQTDLQYRSISDFAPVTLVAEAPLVLAIHKDVPATNLAEFAAWLKSSSRQVSYGSSGAGSSPHLSGEIFKKATQANLVHVPYRGSAPMVLGLRRGDVSMIFDIIGNVVPLTESGEARVIGVASRTKQESTGDAPPMMSDFPALDVSYWMGIYTRAGTDTAIVNRMADEIATVMKDQEIRRIIAQYRLQPVGSSPEEFRKRWDQESDKMAPIVKDVGLKSID